MRKSFRVVLSWLLPSAALLVLGSCCSTIYSDVINAAKKVNQDIAIVLVQPDGTTTPNRVVVKSGQQGVLWISNAETMVFVPDPNKTGLPLNTVCVGGVCWSEKVFTVPTPPATFTYSFKLVCKGKPDVAVDPQLEVVP